MKKILIGGKMDVSTIAYGCMHLAELDDKSAEKHLMIAIEAGINFFDHADIYGKGQCEEVFGRTFDHSQRDKVFIQTKCGIRKGFYDFSADHIIRSAENSLSKMKLDYLDCLLLHRPDTLMENDEVAMAFEKLYREGKVRNFGVSNFKPLQIEYLKKAVSFPLMINQLQFGLAHTGMIDSGIHANMKTDSSFDHDGSILEYSRINNMTIQAWSPFRNGSKKEFIVGHPDLAEMNQCLNKYALIYDKSPAAVALAWVLRHPAKMQAIVGTTKTPRLLDLCTADEIDMSREEWYEIYRSAGNIIP